MDLPPDFRDLLEELGRAKVEFVVVGGYAVALHGRPRATKDIDIVLRGNAANLDRAARAIAAFGATSVVIDAIRTMAEMDVVYMGQPPMRVDFLRSIDGVDMDEVFARAVGVELDGMPIHFISVDDLIANKRAAGRPQDLVDVVELEKIKARKVSP